MEPPKDVWVGDLGVVNIWKVIENIGVDEVVQVRRGRRNPKMKPWDHQHRRQAKEAV